METNLLKNLTRSPLPNIAGGPSPNLARRCTEASNLSLSSKSDQRNDQITINHIINNITKNYRLFSNCRPRHDVIEQYLSKVTTLLSIFNRSNTQVFILTFQLKPTGHLDIKRHQVQLFVWLKQLFVND